MTLSAIDPVCGRSVNTAAARFTTGRGAQTRYFCSEDCRGRFRPEASPPPQPAGKKGFWARYLDRLNKTTGGKPPSCCG